MTKDIYTDLKEWIEKNLLDKNEKLNSQRVKKDGLKNKKKLKDLIKLLT